MPSPSPGDFVNAPLTNVAVSYKQDAKAFIAARAFPEIRVKKSNARYPFFTKGGWMRPQAKVRAPGTASTEGSFKLVYKGYDCETYAIHKKIPKELRKNYADNIDPDTQATEFTMEQILMLREIKWASIAFVTGAWATEYQGGVDFGFLDLAAQDPIEILSRYIIDCSRLAGKPINKIVLPPYVLHGIRFNATTRDYFKYTQSGSITTAMIAGALSTDWPVEVLVPSSILNYAPEDEAGTETMGFIFPNHILLLYAEDSADFMKPTAGYNFLWEGDENAVDGIVTESWWEQKLKSDFIESEMANAVNIVCPDLGVFLLDAVSTAMPVPPGDLPAVG